METDLDAMEIRLSEQRRLLEVDWTKGGTSRYGADLLRDACRCADCSRARRDGVFAPSRRQTITDIQAVGEYALNLTFSDGHARGIFPFAYLREIAAGSGAKSAL